MLEMMGRVSSYHHSHVLDVGPEKVVNEMQDCRGVVCHVVDLFPALLLENRYLEIRIM